MVNKKKRRQEGVEKGEKVTVMRRSKRRGIEKEKSRRIESKNSEDTNRDTKKCPSPITKGTNSFTLKTFTKGTNSKPRTGK